MKGWLIILALLLHGCGSIPFQGSEFNHNVKLYIVIDDDIGKTAKGHTIVGQAYDCQKGDCILFLPSLRWVDDAYNFCVWGHELAHAVFKIFHKAGIPDTCSFYKGGRR